MVDIICNFFLYAVNIISGVLKSPGTVGINPIMVDIICNFFSI